jgi:hypothetical protein
MLKLYFGYFLKAIAIDNPDSGFSYSSIATKSAVNFKDNKAVRAAEIRRRCFQAAYDTSGCTKVDG